MISIVVAGGIIWQDDHLLAALRPQGKPMAGYWEFPGGKLEPGETAEQALCRELREELGISVRACRLWQIVEHDYAERDLHVGFSGGEKKRAEVLQLELLKPKFAIMDETDSGLDVDALRIVSEGVNRAKESTGLGILMVTHYTRILKYIKPDIVHVFADGHFVKTGGPELADELEETGYDKYLPEGSDSESALA